MSRQDTTLINPIFAIEQTVRAAQMEYMRELAPKKKSASLEDVKIAVENMLKLVDLRKNTNKVPYPDARKLFVKIAYPKISIDHSEIMEYIGKQRTSFYHNINQANNLIETDKYYIRIYSELLNSLGL